jgi:hypothetical protein
MLTLFVPKPIRDVYFLFNDIFAAQGYSYPHACALLLFFLLGSERLCEFVRNCPWSPSVSSMSRLAASFEPNRFIRRNQTRILKKLNVRGHGDFCFAVDDTANPKFGSVFGSAPFHSAAGPYFGQKILVLVIVDLRTHEAFPISYAFLTGKKDPQHVPGHHRAIDLIEEAIHNGFPPLPVTADSWFDSKEFIRAIHDLGCKFVGEIKGNRLAKSNLASGRPRQRLGLWFAKLKRHRLSQTKFQKRKEKRGKAFSEKNLFLKDLDLPLKIIAVYNRINGTTPFAFYATTDTSMTGAKLWRFSRARWAIEVLFRDLKQSLGFGGLTAGGEGGAHMAVCIPIILLTSIRLEASEIWNSKDRITLGTTVKIQREMALSKTIDALVHNPDSARLVRLKARRKNPTQKPTNISGERKSA